MKKYGKYAIGVVLLILFAGLIYYFTRPKEEEEEEEELSAAGDVITITEQGSKKETYISMPRMEKCDGGEDQPDWCTAIDPTTEMNYVLDPTGGSITELGGFGTTFNFETNKCADGTTDCLYEEKFDSNRKLTGIMNAKGESFIQKFIDEVYAGKIDFDITRTINGETLNLKDSLKVMIDFDASTGVLYMNRGNERMKFVPGNSSDRSATPSATEMMVSVGLMIVYIILYYYANDLPKPTIKLNLTSQKTFGEIYEAMVTPP